MTHVCDDSELKRRLKVERKAKEKAEKSAAATAVSNSATTSDPLSTLKDTEDIDPNVNSLWQPYTVACDIDLSAFSTLLVLRSKTVWWLVCILMSANNLKQMDALQHEQIKHIYICMNKSSKFI